jgi:hypothetical protein
MTRRRFHILVALVLLVCVVCPYVESALDWNEGILTTGYDTESVVAIIALLLVLSLTLAKLMAAVRPSGITNEPIIACPSPRQREHSFVIGIPEVSRPLPLRI